MPKSPDAPDSVPQFELPPVVKEPTGPIAAPREHGVREHPVREQPVREQTVPLPPAQAPAAYVASSPAYSPPAPLRESGAREAGVVHRERAPSSLPPTQTPMAPAIADTALRMMPKEVAIEHLKSEMLKVHVLQQRIAELEDNLRRSRMRERDLIDLLGQVVPVSAPGRRARLR